MQLLRKMLLTLFILLYLVICPLVILSALGITFKPETQTLLKTGLIHLSSIPAEAAIYINSRQYQDKTPTIIRNLPPGYYSIKILLNNYKMWKKILPVQAEKATSVENILLIPVTWPSEPLTPTPFQHLIPLSPQPVLMITNGPLLKDIYAYNLTTSLKKEIFEDNEAAKNNSLISLFPDDSPYSQSKLVKYFVINDSPHILIQTLLDGKKKYLWVDLTETIPSIEDISELFPSAAEQMIWNKENNNLLFSMNQGSLNRLDVVSRAIYPHIAENIAAFAVYKNHIYVLTKNDTIKRLGFNGKVDKILLDTALGQSLFKKADKIQMSVYADNLVLFVTENGALVSNYLPHRLIEKDVKGLVFNEDKRQLLVWTKDKMGLIDFSQINKDKILKKRARLTWLDIEAKGIQQALFANQGANIIFTDQNITYITETRPFNQPLKHEITPIKKGSSVMYSEENGKLFYLDPKTSNLSFIQIKPESTLLPLPPFEKPKEEKKENEI